MSFAISLISAVALFSLSESKEIKFGVITDIHLNLWYQASIDVG